MLYRINFRAAAVAVATVAGGIFLLYRHLTRKEEAIIPRRPNDEFVLNPPRPASTQEWQRSMNRWNPPQNKEIPSTADQPVRPEELPPALETPETTEDPLTAALNETFKGNEDLLTPEDPEIPPDSVTERSLGRFNLDELRFPDGSLQVRVSEPGTADITSLAYTIPREKVNIYDARADLLTNGCHPIATGGQYCFDYLGGLDVTKYRITGPEGNIREGGRLGRATTYQEFLDESNVHSDVVRGVLFIRHR